MYLKSLEISGFKSFAKKSNLDFKSKVTAIVGPNGSGKSNVAEAFRFVLGEQSIKSLRGKRGEDLIWNGSEETPRGNRAFVKAVFEADASVGSPTIGRRGNSLDFEEVSVERVVSRDGANEYSINGSQVRLRDVVELLSQANIGSSGHHIISQGEADRILSSNMKERRDMVEDALGLKIYKYKKEESERKLEKTSQNIKEVESLRREIAPHIKFLKKQMEKVERALETKERLTSIHREYLKREKDYLEVEKESLKKEKEPLVTKKEILEEEMRRARSVLESSSEKDGKSEKLLKVEEEVANTRKRRESFERELGKLEGQITANSRIIESEKSKSQNLESTISLSELEGLAEEIFALTDASLIKEKIKDFIEKNKNSTRSSVVSELELKNKDLEQEKKDIEHKIKVEEENLESLNNKYAEIKKEIEREKDSERGAEREMFRIASEETSIDSALNMLRLREEKLKFEEEEFLKEVREAGALLGQAVIGFERLEVLQEERALQEERRRELEKMKIRLEELGGAGGEEVAREYKDAEERDQFLEKELTDLASSALSLGDIITDLENRLLMEFKEGINKINHSFQDFFVLMFGGGKAELIVESRKSIKSNEEEEETEEGIDILVSLPKKRIKGLQMLSGGERALTSIALLFAISQVNPPPFIILDETDAALDEANSKKYGDMIESLSRYSQLILITHNRETMSRAGVIYGVTMGSSGASRLLSIAFDEAVTVAK